MAEQLDEVQDTETSAPLKEPKPPFKKQQQQPPGLESALDPAPRFEAPRYKAAGKLKGQIALITGGDSGIGRAVATLYAREGANVAIVYLPEEQSDAEDTRAIVEAEGRICELIPGDLADPAFCDEVVERTVGAFGRLDILVSNAAQQSSKKLEDLKDEDLERTFQVNVFAYVRLARAALAPHEARRCDHRHEFRNWHQGFEGTCRTTRRPKGAVNAFTKTLVDGADRATDSCQCGRAGAGLDTAQSGRYR